MKFKKILAYVASLIVLALPILVSSQGGSNTVISINIPNPTTAGSNLMSLITALLNNVVMPVAAVAVVMWIIWAGFSYVLAQGNPKKIEIAHQRLIWSLIGAGILLGAVGISAVVQGTINSVLR
ncbi:MAG: hypothetical protein WAX37_02170 [Minisyncoccia bacterium]